MFFLNLGGIDLNQGNADLRPRALTNGFGIISKCGFERRCLDQTLSWNECKGNSCISTIVKVKEAMFFIFHIDSHFLQPRLTVSKCRAGSWNLPYVWHYAFSFKTRYQPCMLPPHTLHPYPHSPQTTSAYNLWMPTIATAAFSIVNACSSL